MATKETRVQESTCAVPVFERNRYFYGKPMTVRDFEAEQRYLIGKSHFLNRLIYGAGILCGLQVQVSWNVESNKPSVQLSEGAALDCCGNLIVVSRLGPVVVEGEFQDGLNYLSIQYAECVKQPIMASTNASSCKEVCCYNRVQETFRVSVSADAPAVADATVSGTVQEKSGNRPVHGARVEALGKGKVRASALTDAQGAYTLRVSSGEYDLRASGSGFNTSQATRRKISKSPAVTLDFKLDAATSDTEAAAVCNQLTQNYFEDHLREPPECHDPKVLLAVVKIEPGTMRGTRPVGKTEVITVNAEETRKHRPVVNNNPMLHDLLCSHVADFNNPHRTDASQVRALRSINHVGNTAQGTYQSNVDLVSGDNTITIDPDATDNGNDIDLKLSPDAVKREHLNADVFNNLVVAKDFGLNVTSKPAERRIELSMGAPQQVKSVQAVSDVGTSKLFAREDHAHNLQINGRGPDAQGTFLLTGGQNVTVVAGRANELVIDAKVGGGGGGDVTSGLLIFANVEAGETRLSQPIVHGLDVTRVGIILSLEFQTNDDKTGKETSDSLVGNIRVRTVPNPNAPSCVMGDFAEVYPRSPHLIAYCSTATRTFQVYLKDRHSTIVGVPDNPQPPEQPPPPKPVPTPTEQPTPPRPVFTPIEEPPIVRPTEPPIKPPDTPPIVRPTPTAPTDKVERPEETETRPQLPDESHLGGRPTPILVHSTIADESKILEQFRPESFRNAGTRAIVEGAGEESRKTNDEGTAEALTATNRLPLPTGGIRRTYHVRWWAIASGREMPSQLAVPTPQQHPFTPDEDFSLGQILDDRIDELGPPSER